MSVYSFSYDRGYDPAMPVVEVRLLSPHSQASFGPITAVIDSGADGTMIPENYLDEIGALSVGTAVMSGIWGHKQRVNLYIITLQIGAMSLHGIHAAGVPEGADFILGRNTINQLEITLNGPAHTVQIPKQEER